MLSQGPKEGKNKQTNKQTNKNTAISDAVSSNLELGKGAFIVYCNAAAVPMYRLLVYRSSTHQRTAAKLKLTLLQYRNAVVGAETAFRALQLTATQLQWTMNAAYVVTIAMCQNCSLYRICILMLEMNATKNNVF